MTAVRRQDLRHVRGARRPSHDGWRRRRSNGSARPADARRHAPHLACWCSAARCSTGRPRPTIEKRFDAERRPDARAAQRERLPAAARRWSSRAEQVDADAAVAARPVAGCPPRIFDLLSLFDAFEHDGEPYSFRDLILGQQICRADRRRRELGRRSRARCTARARSPRSPRCRCMSRAATRSTRAATKARANSTASCCSISARPRTPELEELFRAAPKTAEADQRFAEAAALYQRCLAIDPSDSVAAFNRANCLRAHGRRHARPPHAYARAIKLDPGFVEAWFNLAGLMSDDGRDRCGARGISRKAIALDPDYADAVYNLATLEYRRRQISARRGAGGRAISNSTDRIASGRETARARHRRSIDLPAAHAEDPPADATDFLFDGPRGCARHHPAGAWRRRADGFGLDERHRQGARRGRLPRRALRVRLHGRPPHRTSASRRPGPKA